VNPEFGPATEQRWREEFLAQRRAAERHLLERCCAVFRAVLPGESILDRSHTTNWVRSWNAFLATRTASTRSHLLWSLDRWWAWLFDRRVLDANVLAFFSCQALAVDAVEPLTLRCNLHRHIDEHLRSLSRVTSNSIRSYRGWLMRFNVFLNRLPTVPTLADGRLEIDDTVLAAWFRHLDSRCVRTSFKQAVATLSEFFDGLVHKGVLVDNALERLSRQHPRRGRTGVARALIATDRDEAFRALIPQPMFMSALAGHLAGFLELKHAVGCRSPHGAAPLRDFDRFLAARGERGPVTRDLFARWFTSRPDLSPSNRIGRFGMVRQFCVYLRRHAPNTYVPDQLLGRVRPGNFKPRIIAPSEMKALLDAVDAVIAGTRSPLHPRTCRTLLTVLYTTGLRISEALHLQMRDVDLRERVITIRETKFYKSRLVPFSDGLLPILRDYQRERLRLFGDPAPEAPFFVGQFGASYCHRSVNTFWKKLLCQTGLGGPGRGNGPRIHDLRHSFATLRLAAWYREGADVQAKLPLLSTYLGHGKITATQRYLTILPETKLAASERFRLYGGALIASTGEAHERT